MSFKTMDGVEVYDKHDTDTLLETERGRIHALEDTATTLNNGKASKSELSAERDRINTLESHDTDYGTRITQLESDKTSLQANKADKDALEAERTRINNLDTNKAEKTYAEQTRQIANNNKSNITELETRTTALEENAATKSELAGLVASEIDNVINTKVAGITSDIGHIVDNAVDDALENYDDAAAADAKVDQKIATATTDMATQAYVDQAIAAIPNPGVASTADIQAIVNQYF